MTATTGGSHYRFRHAARMEWVKLRSLRSTWWTLAVTIAAAAAIAVAVGVNTEDAAGDLTNNALAGISVGLLLTGILGVLTATSEHTSGTIRSTLAAIPNRPLVLAAKAAVLGAVALAAGEAAARAGSPAPASASPACSGRWCSAGPATA
jgi:ABC-2 type transport system permease protein